MVENSDNAIGSEKPYPPTRTIHEYNRLSFKGRFLPGAPTAQTAADGREEAMRWLYQAETGWKCFLKPLPAGFSLIWRLGCGRD